MRATSGQAGLNSLVDAFRAHAFLGDGNNVAVAGLLADIHGGAGTDNMYIKNRAWLAPPAP